jgi:hypothetical protein
MTNRNLEMAVLGLLVGYAIGGLIFLILVVLA